MGFFQEHPADPVTYLKGDQEEVVNKYVSWWRMEPWMKFRNLFRMKELTYEQGALGHPAVKPTTNGTNYAALEELNGLRMKVRPEQAGNLISHQLAEWAPRLRQKIAEAILGPQLLPPQLRQDDGCVARKMTGGQREVWRKHLEADHIPYRAHCSVCVEAQATGRPHRRRARHSGFALAVDLAGPFNGHPPQGL